MRLPPHVQEAISECAKLGVGIRIDKSTKNYKGWITIKDQKRLVVMSLTPSDWRAPLKVRTNVRHLVREMRELTT